MVPLYLYYKNPQNPILILKALSLRVHVPIEYIPGHKRASRMVALGPKHILYGYMDPYLEVHGTY